MTPAQQQAARIEKDVEASALGRELMMPLPPEWGRTINELTVRGGWGVVMTHKDQCRMPFDKRMDHTAAATNQTLEAAHRLCREQAWAKHRKNTEEA